MYTQPPATADSHVSPAQLASVYGCTMGELDDPLMIANEAPPSLLATAKGRGRPVGILRFAAVSYFLVCGGPIGIEYAVIYAGPLLTLVGFLVTPIMWSIPQAIMTAELSTALPDNGGYVLWAQFAFGDFCGFVAGINGIVSSLVDSTLYPTLLSTYVLAVIQYDLPQTAANATTLPSFQNTTTVDSNDEYMFDWTSITLALVCVVVGLAINVLGLENVSTVSLVCFVIIVLPFLMYFIALSPEIFSAANFSTLADVPIFQTLPWKDVQWGAFLSTLVWSYTGYDSVGCIAGEVKSAEKTFLLGSLLTILFVSITYAMPIASMVTLHPKLNMWADGCIVTFLGDVGSWLVVWGCISAVVQNLGS